jgi:hypothetical protein
MPNTGLPLAHSSRTAATAYVTAAGSPGPFERKKPCAPSASASSAGVVAGTTVTRQPTSRSWRRMFCLIPKSYATTWCSIGSGGAVRASSVARHVGSVHS